MNNKKENSTKLTGCGGFLATALTIIFVIAKLVGLVTWKWWVCFLPLIIDISLVIVLFIIICIIIAIVQ